MNSIVSDITNRAIFQTASFNVTTAFLPDTDPVKAAVRELLQLNDPSTDYYVQAVLVAVYSFPEILASFAPDDQVYTLQDYVNDPLYFQNCTGVGSGAGPFNIARPPRFPIDPVITVAYNGPFSAVITLDGTQTVVTTGVQGNTIFPDWGDLGITGGLVLASDAWAPGFTATIRALPDSFDYGGAAASLDADNDKTTLLLRAGLISHYALAQGPMEKVATTALALKLA